MAESAGEGAVASALHCAKYPSPNVELSVVEEDNFVPSPIKSPADSDSGSSNATADAAATVPLPEATRPPDQQLAAQYRLDRRLIVKLEAPPAQLTAQSPQEHSSSPPSESRSHRNRGSRPVPSDVSNGVVTKTKRTRSKQESATSGDASDSGNSTRGRPPKRHKQHVAAAATYHSQISGDKNAIKIRIRKSNLDSTLQVNFTL